jgi:hypothetical protein
MEVLAVHFLLQLVLKPALVEVELVEWVNQLAAIEPLGLVEAESTLILQ